MPPMADARRARQTSRHALGHEARLQLRRWQTKRDVHIRATVRLGAPIKTLGAVERAVEERSFLAVARLSRGQTALCQQVLRHQATRKWQTPAAYSAANCAPPSEHNSTLADPGGSAPEGRGG